MRRIAMLDVIIIGAGAAGLMCASHIHSPKQKVLILERANKPGKKILMSGGGRCNFTNYYIEPSKYLSHNPHFVKSALSRYTQWDFIALVEQYGISYHEKKDGQLFCDNKASDILNMLLDECSKQNVDIKVNSDIETIEQLDNGFKVHTTTASYTCRQLVIASGGPSIPTLGSSDFAFRLAKQLGLNTYPLKAGLVPFVFTDETKELCVALSGTALPVTVNCAQQSFSDDLLFTHRGLSGPAILQISSYWQSGDVVEIDLLPSLNLADYLREQQHKRAKTLLRTLLAELTTQKFAEQWLQTSPYQHANLAELNGKAMDDIANNLHHWQVKPAGTEGYRTAEVALGGLDTDEASSKTMEIKRMPNLYFIGEALDVTGWLGGYNFQWAWSSAYAAAQAINAKLN